MANETVKKHKGTHKAAFPVGLLISFLALVGLATIIVLIATGVKNLAAKNKDYTEYNKLLTPVVLIDPTGFDDITKADMSELIEISIWAIIKSDISPDTYPMGEGGMIIPAADVEAQFKRLFGTEVAPVHTSVEGYEYEFSYNTDDGTYTIPITSVVPIYTPRVVEKKETAGTVVLTVALIPGEGWQQSADGSMTAPSADKYIHVTLREKDGAMFISAIQATTAPEIASTDTPATESATSRDTLADITASETSSPNTVDVTDENGEKVTDENGNALTETVSDKSTAEESSAAQ